MWNGRHLALSYRRAGQSGVRALKLGPLGLVLKGGIWYLVAQNGKAVRTYRVSNILDAQMLDEEFAHAPFDLPAYWEHASRDYIAGLYRESAQVRVTRAGFVKLEALGPFVAQAAAKTARKPDKQGWIRCTVPIESVAVGARDLLRLGEEVEVLGPPALRREFKATLAAMLARHALKPRAPRSRAGRSRRSP